MPSSPARASRPRLGSWLLPPLLACVLAACGDSGGFLVISEVSANGAPDDAAWVEIYNPSRYPVRLADYQLRTSASDGEAAQDPAQPHTFALPDVSVPSHGLLVLAAATRVSSWSHDTDQIVHVKDGALSPWWGSSGFVELVQGGASADFVRFGDSSTAPLSEGAWSGPNLAALPAGKLAYGRSIVRPMPQGAPPTLGQGASHWAQVNFATPAGVNDVAAGVIDSDGDGIPDSAKQPGGSYGGLDLYAMGARAGQRGIFMQIDYMADPGDGRHDPMLRPRKEALQKVVDAFARSPTRGKPYALHIDVGALYAPDFSPADFNLGGGKEVAFHPCLAVPSKLDPYGWIGTVPEGCRSIHAYKSEGFDLRRRLVFHYAIFGNSQQADGSPGSSGLAELYGNDFIVTLGSLDVAGAETPPAPQTPAQEHRLINTQAGTLMHEFGHNLGLGHGGDDLMTNYKPNYLSIMNYLHQMTGLSASFTDARAAERYLLDTQDEGSARRYVLCERPGGNPPGVVTVSNSPCTADFRLDYSDGSGQPLDTARLHEGLNLGRGSDPGAFADWNHNGVQDAAPYALCLNPQNFGGYADCPAGQVLTDFNDWDNLVLPFSRYYSGSNNGAPLQTLNKSAHTPAPAPRHPRQWIVETSTPSGWRQ
ncbi:lamin tail domain-containing protein [Comamonas sp. NLF-1-9]|uniref:lamin tail domain-containing protein n=1 Tax=Comamonas sp. NLF-1-9 TaxID=2853163 RepID=UPI001C453A3A|nr:lamin tail domain-containing protein [Comamonas sp. NLF-1-9]QXL84819.1 lamin tail domain-containing protein [Comamonas sp. NLF-1-9]